MDQALKRILRILNLLFDKPLPLIHELVHLYKIIDKSSLLLGLQEPFIKYYSETQATNFMIQIMKFFKIKPTKYEKEVLKKLIIASEKMDKKKGNIVINIDI